MLASSADSSAGTGGEADDPLLAFNAETDHDPAAAPASSTRRVSMPLLLVVIGAVLVAVTYSVVQARNVPGTPAASSVGHGPGTPVGIAAAASASGSSVDITSRPPGAAVTIDGEGRGVTPLHLSLAVGSHLVGVSTGLVTSTLPLTVDGGVAVRQHVEFAAEPTGQPPIAAVTPSATNTALVDRDAAAALPLAAAAPAAAPIAPPAGTSPDLASIGWVRITSPIELEVFELDRLIEPSASGRLRLTPGRHDLEVVNPKLNFRSALRVQVPTGRTVNAAVAVPNGSLSINAIPWANVSIDNRSVGITPLGNLSLPIGQHEVIWRHPELGERRQTVTISDRLPLGIGMDMTQ